MASQLSGTGAPMVWGPRPERKRGRDSSEGPDPEAGSRLRTDVSMLVQARFLAAQETERRRIARDLHDVVGQALTAVKLSLESIGRGGGLPDPGVVAGIEESISTVDTVIQVIRTFAMDLRPSALDDLGLPAALRSFLGRSVRDTGVEARFSAERMDERYPAAIETACYRIAQEAITNVLRHAEATRITVRLRRKERNLRLEVLDDGRGFDRLDADRTRTSLGLVGMSERAELAGGTLVVHSVVGEGTLVEACFPLPAAPRIDCVS
jgi:signal transduction histidine kinase